MKLAVCIVHNRDKNRLTDELLRQGFKFTLIGSTGGFLREGNSTLLIGIEDNQAQTIRDILANHCQSREQVVNLAMFEANAPQAGMLGAPIKVPVGGAVLFILPVDDFARF